MASRVGLGSPGGVGLPARRGQMGDQELASFYQEVYQPLVRRATWRHGLPIEDARDVVQDAFVLAIEKIDSERNPRAWLTQVVDHLCLNHSRKTFRRRQLSARWGLTGSTPPGDSGLLE